METPEAPSSEAEPGPEEVLRFLAERGGRARQAELVQHFRGALGGEAEQRARARARFKEVVNAVAVVRTDPADGTKYVHLKRKLCPGPPPQVEGTPAAPGNALLGEGQLSPSPAGDPPRVQVTPAPASDEAIHSPAEPREIGENGDFCGAASPEDVPGVQEIEASQAPPGQGREPDHGASLVTGGHGGTPRKTSQSDGHPLAGASVPALGENLERPISHCEEEGNERSPPGGSHTPRPVRHNVRDLVVGSSPQLRRSTSGPGRSRSAGDSDSASLASSSAEEESSGGGGGSVTLDPLEHAWMLSASEGKWDSLEGLLACEPGLLAKRDFITGFTCLHWAAKHGRQELLAMLVNFANKHQLPVNINARTSGGYTALHLAAMHGHVEVVKLLVGAYDADVDIRDYSGRKASQYLSQSIAEEIKSLVGALDDLEGESAGSGVGGRWRLSRMLPSHLITYRLSHVLEDGGDHHHHHHHHHHLPEGWAGGKAKDPGRKASGSSSGRLKPPRLNKIRFRTQIIHTTPSFRDPEQPLEEGEEEEDRPLKGHSSSFKLRPKSNVFG